MSVNEQATSDTSATTEAEEFQEERKPDVLSALKGDHPEEEKIEELENEGIQSSDDEHASADASQAQGLKAFHEQRMFESYKEKDESLHGFNFGEEDLDNYESNLQAKLDDKSSRKRLHAEVESGPIDYIGEAEDTPATDMTNLNLFGDPDTGTEQASRREITKKRQVMRELIDAMERLDPNNEL